jgi:CHAT domain-containing protein/tetratricopeptide (TPR) repeat protein
LTRSLAARLRLVSGGEGLRQMESRILRRRPRSPAGRRALLAAAAAAVALFRPFGPPPPSRVATAQEPQTKDGAERAREIAAGTPASGDIRGTDSRLFKLRLTRGQYVRVAVEKGDLQLSATRLSADMRQLSEHVGRRFGPLRFSFVAEDDGDTYLRLESLEKDSDARRYELRVEARDATAKDGEAAAASRACSEAEALRAKWDQASLRAALVKYSEALAAWAGAGDGREQAQTLRDIGECHFTLSEYREALDAYTKALSLSRSVGDGGAELDALNDAGYVRVYLGEKQTALRYFEQVLSSADDRGAESRRRKAQALNNEGEAYYSLSEFRKALGYFERSLAAWAEVGDRGGEALAHLNLGYAHTDLGDLQNASDHYQRSLALWRAVGDPRGEALSLTAIGGLNTFLGEKQTALDYHQQAMRAFRALGNAQGEASSLNGIGLVYEYSNQPRAALDSYQSALQLYERIGNRDFAALSRYYVGRVYQSLGDSGRALEDYLQSMRLSHEIGDRQVEAHAVRGVGTVYESQGERKKALAQYAEALKLYKRIGDRRWQARTLNSIGYVRDAAGEKRRALDYYGRALRLSREVEDRREEVSALYNIAHAERDLGDIDKAVSSISAAVALVESLRLKVAGEQLRTSYFASVHQHYELYIDLLMQEHKRRPDGGFAAAAFQASERARSRSLLERLAQQKVAPGSGPGQELLGRERAVWQRLDFKLESQTKLLNGPHTEAEAAAGAAEIRALTAAYQQVLDEIKRESPLYASMTQTQSLRAEVIQSQLAGDAVLLEYSLGRERSYVWAVTHDTVEGYELPPGAYVEGLAQEVYGLLTARQRAPGEQAAPYRQRVEAADANYPQRAAELSRVLLGPVAGRLAGKRIVVVCDGALHRVPFDALPEPDAAPADATPLVVNHEVVTAPSASVLSALRDEAPTGEGSPRLIAVLADPVFDVQDSRANSAGGRATAEPTPEGDALLREALADAGESGGESSLPRLTSSLREAEAIEELTPPAERAVFKSFDANLENVTGGGLGNFRIIHFATHGIFNDERPELSGLILSRVDERGRRRDGFLRTGDVYNLRLNADLVVLSACRTGLGHNVNGEGILGITRAFMYAGSRGVVASLWKVNDEATAELMGHFYRAMFREGLPPSAALRAAKERMWKQERWRSPYFWAAFVMQGDGNRRPPAVADARVGAPVVVMAVGMPALAALLVLALVSARRRRRESAGARAARGYDNE